MSSQTTTITSQITGVEIIHLTLVTGLQKVKDDVSSQLKNVLAANIFEESTEEQLRCLGNDFQKFTAETGAITALCFIICEIIRPLCITLDDDNAIKILFQFEDALKNCLKALNPIQDVDTILNAYEERIAQEKLLKEQRQAIQAAYQTQLNQLNQYAVEMMKKIEAAYKALKSKLSTLVQSREKMSAETAKKFEDLSAKIEALSAQILHCTKQTNNAASAIKEHHETTTLLLRNCETLLKEI